MRNLSLVLALGLTVAVPLLPACAFTPAPRAAAEDPRAFAAAVATMCDVDQKAGLAVGEDPLGLGLKRTAWITENVGNPDVIELRVLMSVKGASEQGCMLRDRAREVGVKSCALAESLATTGEGGLSP